MTLTMRKAQHRAEGLGTGLVQAALHDERARGNTVAAGGCAAEFVDTHPTDATLLASPGPRR
ncbi:MAG: hypothetical protein EXQ71_03530 [Acidimicrobiia bacterium]|nr:hypothetical protein [Acidimicrobiia bacterium]